MQKMKLLSLTSLALMFSLNQAQAAGFATDLYSASGLANSYAGAAAGSNDISDSHHNPAVLSMVESNSLVLTVNYLNVDIDDDNTSAKNGSAFGGGDVSGSRNNDGGIDNAVLPSFYYASRINDKTVIGVSVTTPFALSTKYDDNWTGRYHAIESSIETVNFNPAVSYQINDKLSIGAGVQVQYIKAILTKAAFDGFNDHLGKLKGDDWGYGYNFGATYKVNDVLDLGLGYRSKIKHTLKGKGSVAGLGHYSSITAALSTPESAYFGATYDLNDKVELLAGSSWTRWSRVQELNVIAPQNTVIDGDDTTLKYNDTWQYALGANYQLNEQLQLKSGLAYEEGANSSSDYRSPRIPGGDKIWVTLGFEYKINKDLKFDFAYLHQYFKKASSTIDATNLGSSLDTTYKTRVNSFAVGLGWNF